MATEPAAARAGTPLAWSLAMLGLLTLYLFPELIFNAKLVAVAGGRGSSDEALRSVELFGRTVSGIGVSLLLADLWIRGRLARGIARPLACLGLTLLLVWPLVFFGQKWLVDRWLIAPSTPEQRQRAVLSQLLRASLADNTIAIDAIPGNGDQPPSPAEMAFLTLFGALAYADPQLTSAIEEQRAVIARQFVRNRVYRDFTEHYRAYRDLRDQVRQSYREYLDQNEKYRRELNGVGDRAGALWQQAEQRVADGWREYRQGVERLDRRALSLAEEMGPSLYRYFDRRNTCRSDSCRKRLDQRYRTQMTRSPLGYVEPAHWLIAREVSAGENLLKSGLMAALTGGVSVALQGLDKATGGDGGWADKEYSYTDDRDHYRRRVRLLLEPEFRKQSGYPSTLGSFDEFRGHGQTGREVADWCRQRGMALPENWTMAQRTTFDRAARAAVRERIRAAWRERADGMPPGLSWDRFQQQDAVQREIRTAMGRFYIAGTRADWNNAQFKQRVLDPLVEREAQRLVAEVEAQAATFADGGVNEARAKRALRATLVPPISMTLSLALVLMTLVKIPLKARGLWRQHRGRPSRLSGRGQLSLRLGLIAGILLAPVLLGKVFLPNPYVDQNRATHYFLERVRENGSPLGALALGWALRAQPVMLPAGLGLEQELRIYRGFAVFEPRLQRWDRAWAAVGRRYRQLKETE